MQKAVLEEKEEMLAELKVLRGELKKMNVEIAEVSFHKTFCKYV